jgi:hypothetical protein
VARQRLTRAWIAAAIVAAIVHGPPQRMFKGGDGYTMFPGGQVVVAPEAGNLIVGALEKYVAAKRVIAPQIEGRITVR